MEWQISVPIFSNALILKQLGIAVGIPFGIVAIIIGVTSGKSIYTLYALGLIFAVLLFTWLFILIFYKGKYEAEFVLNEKGVLCRTGPRQAKKNRIVNSLAVLMGLFSGKPAVAGAGLLAQSRQEVFLRWSSVTKVKLRPKSKTIVLRGSWTQSVALFCSKENYPLVEQFILMNVDMI